jgi:PhnB protein
MSITPYLLYEDVGEALKFLSRAFGFRKSGEAMKGADGKLNHAAMQLGKDAIMMGYPGPKYKNPKRLGQATQSLYIVVNDVDKHFARAKKAGATVLQEPEDMFYGHRRYGAVDPEGHEWYFAQDIPAKGARKKRAAQGRETKRSTGGTKKGSK